MPSFNRVIIMGNLTKSPELRYTPAGTPVTSLSIAVNRQYRQGEELKKEVSYFDVVLFGKTAETAAQYTDKGDCVQIDGRLQQRRWETSHGDKRSKVEIVGEHVTFIKTKKSGERQEEEHGYEEPYS